MKKAVIFCGGKIYDYNYIKSLLSEEFFLICCDSGIYHAKAAGLVPNLIVGDFDSADISIFPTVEKKSYIPEKDETDTQIAVDYALDNGYDTIWIFGGLGGRLDHELGNLALLKRIKSNGAVGALINEKNFITLLAPDTPYRGKRSQLRHKYVSLIAFGADATGVFESGVKYPLENAIITSTSTLGISNEVIDEEFCLSVGNGELVLVFSDD